MNEDTYWLYTQMLIDGEAQGKTHEEIADLLKIHRNTIHNWNKSKIDWQYINTERRKRYGEKISRVDDAIFKQAHKGDVNAAKLVYERFDGYTPTTANIDLSKKTDKELDELIDNEISEIEKRKNDKSSSPGKTEASA